MEYSRLFFGNKYQIDHSPLGQGGMGKVYKGIEIEPQRIVAIKILDNLDDEFLKRFVREAQTLAKLGKHKALPILYEINSDRTKEVPFLAMEFIEGDNLRKKLNNGVSWNVSQIIKFLDVMVDALIHMHDNKVIHRDIKPENIIISNKDQFVLVDFGLAYHEDTLRITPPGQVGGTPIYMSPEQIENKVPLDGRTDIYSLGLVAYEFLIGPDALRKELGNPTSIFELSRQKLSTPYTPLSSIRKDLGGTGLPAIIDRCIRINREDRFKDARALKEALVKISGLSNTTQLVEPVDPKKRINPVLTGSLVLILLMAPLYFFLPLPEQEIARLPSETQISSPSSTPAEIILEGHQNGVNTFSVLPKKQLLISGSDDHALKLWSMNTWEPIDSLTLPDQVWSIYANREETVLIAGLDNNSAVYVDLTSERLATSRIGELSAPIRAVAFNSNSDHFAVGSDAGEIIVGEAGTKQENSLFSTEGGRIRALAFSPLHPMLVSAGLQEIILWNYETGEQEHHFEAGEELINALDISLDGTLLAAGGDDKLIRLWDFREKVLLHQLAFNRNTIRAIAFNQAASVLAVGDEHMVRLIDVSSGKELQILEEHEGGINALKFLPDDRLISASDDGTMRISTLSLP